MRLSPIIALRLSAVARSEVVIRAFSSAPASGMNSAQNPESSTISTTESIAISVRAKSPAHIAALSRSHSPERRGRCADSGPNKPAAETMIKAAPIICSFIPQRRYCNWLKYMVMQWTDSENRAAHTASFSMPGVLKCAFARARKRRVSRCSSDLTSDRKKVSNAAKA